MANTGKQRSLTVVVSKTVAGVQQTGYPKTYYGRNTFIHNGTTYTAIDTLMMTTMPVVDYQARLSAFKSYVENLESGLDIDDVVVAGEEAYRDNLTACPIS